MNAGSDNGANAGRSPSEEPILEAIGVRKAFGGLVVLDGVSVKVFRGRVALLRGPNGSGKTVLTDILTGLAEPDDGQIILRGNHAQRTLSFPRPWWMRLLNPGEFGSNRFAHHGIGRTWQDLRLFGTLSLRENLAVADIRSPADGLGRAMLAPTWISRVRRTAFAHADESLEALGLAGREASYADQVSLGQAKRASIAQAARVADLLFLDEPLAGLDGPGVAAVLELLRQIRNDPSKTLVITEHALNLPILLPLADEVWSLSGGRLRCESPGEVLEELTKSEETHQWHPWTFAVGAHATVRREEWSGGAAVYRITPHGGRTGATTLEVEDLA